MGDHCGGSENRWNSDAFESSSQHLLLVIEEQALVKATGTPEVLGADRHAGALDVGYRPTVSIDRVFRWNIPQQNHFGQGRRQTHFAEDRQRRRPEPGARLIEAILVVDPRP